MKKILHTSFPCLVRCGQEESELSVNEKLIIESGEKIFVYPTNKNRCSFEVDPLSPSPFYRMIKRNGDYLIFLLDGLYSENVLCKEFSYRDTRCKVEVGKRTITFNGNDKKIIHLLSEPASVELGSFLYICYALYKTDDGQTLIAYNPKHNSAKVFSADKIEIEKEGFTLYKSPYSYKDIIERYYVDSEGLKVLDKTFSHLPNSFTPAEGVVYKFMTAIKCGDYAGALEMLNKPLQNKLNEKSLKEFFGDISYFYTLDSQTCFAISNNKNMIYDFSTEEDKIADIDTNEENFYTLKY